MRLEKISQDQRPWSHVAYYKAMHKLFFCWSSSYLLWGLRIYKTATNQAIFNASFSCLVLASSLMQGVGGGGFGPGKLENIRSTYYRSPVTTLDRFLSGQNSYHSSHDNVVYDDVVVSGNGSCGVWPSSDHVMGGGSYGGYGFVPPSGSDEETTSFVDGVLLDGEVLQREADDQERNEEMVTAKMTQSGGKRTKRGPRVALIKGQWTDEEDRKLIKMVKQYGIRKWAKVAETLVGRAGKQCRERWHNHLRPDIKKDRWSDEEERIFVEVHQRVGNRWAEIAKVIPGRSENTIKNHWNATIRKQNSLSRRKRKHQSSKTQSQKQHKSSILQEYIKTKLNNLGNINNNINNMQDTTLDHNVAPSICTPSSEDVPSLPLTCPAYDDELLYIVNLLANRNQNINIINDVLNVNVVPTTTDHEVAPNFGEEVSGALSTQLCSDRYLSYLFNETNAGSSSWSMKRNVVGSDEVAYSSSNVTDHNVKKEMDLMEMVSSSQASNYSCSFSLF